jgi:hypothetical protein
MWTPHMCNRDFERNSGRNHTWSSICSDCVLLISLRFWIRFSFRPLSLDFVRLVDFLSWDLFRGLPWGKDHYLDHWNHMVWAVCCRDPIWTRSKNSNKTLTKPCSFLCFLICDWFTNPFEFCQRFETRGSLDRQVNCRRVPQPTWAGARRSAKGGGSRRETGVRGGNPAAFVFVPCPGRVRLQ